MCIVDKRASCCQMRFLYTLFYSYISLAFYLIENNIDERWIKPENNRFVVNHHKTDFVKTCCLHYTWEPFLHLELVY